MMKFDCPHCGQQLVHTEEVAGREGWCRFCKCILIMPRPGENAVRPTLTLQQQFAQLERMFRFAAGIVDEHRQLQSSLNSGNQALAQEIRLRTDAQRSAQALRSEVARNKVAHSLLDVEHKRLADRLEQNNSEHAACLMESKQRLAQAENKLHADGKRDDVLLGRVLAIEEDINRAERVAKESFDDFNHDRELLERLLKNARKELSEAQESEATLKVRIEESDDRERLLRIELAERDSAAEEARVQYEEALASLEAANERHDALAERYSALDQSLEETQARSNTSNEGWEEQRQQLCDEVDHYRAVMQKVEHDLAAIETKRQKNELLLQTRLEEQQIELLRETTLRIKTERLYESANQELAESKAALASAEENLELLRQSTNSLKSEIGTAFQAKVV